MADPSADLVYVGFWLRVVASVIDSLLYLMILVPVLVASYGSGHLMAAPAVPELGEMVLEYLLPAVACVLFWHYKSATPGKMAIAARIVDAQTGAPPTIRQSIIRYLGYFVSTIPLFLGLIWVGLDARKQGWHDKLAGTVVVRPKAAGRAEVHFGKNAG